MRREGEALVVEVADDGVGGVDPSAGSGLRGLDDRVAAVGGTLDDRQPARLRHAHDALCARRLPVPE